MRAIAITTVIIDILCWFFGTIGYLAKYLNHNATTSTSLSQSDGSTASNLGLLIFMIVLLILNIVTLFYIFKNNDIQQGAPKSSSNVKKIFVGFAWFAILYFASCFMTGAILGAIVGASSTVNQQADIAAVTHNFFIKYGYILFVGSILVATIGTVKGWLPFTKTNEEV